jgi:hypothetical protein
MTISTLGEALDEVARLKEQVENLQEKNDNQRTSLSNLVNDQALVRKIERIEEDGKYIAKELAREARERGWCSEYGAFVAHVNEHTSELKLGGPRNGTVRLTYSVDIEAEVKTDDQTVDLADLAYNALLERNLLDPNNGHQIGGDGQEYTISYRVTDWSNQDRRVTVLEGEDV